MLYYLFNELHSILFISHPPPWTYIIDQLTINAINKDRSQRD